MGCRCGFIWTARQAGLTRAIERGAKGMEFLMTSAAFEVVPLLIEVIFVSALLWGLFGFEYAVITL